MILNIAFCWPLTRNKNFNVHFANVSWIFFTVEHKDY